ncbi:hypothetical protein AB0J65_31800, partial [Streptomyces toxytricini]
DDVRRAADQLPADHADHADHVARVLADIVLEEERRLSGAPDGTVRCAQGRARLIRALYERLDRLTEAAASRPAGAL